MWYLCDHIYHTTPDDPRVTDMDPVQKMWMFENWFADQNDEAELAKNQALLIGSFINPDAVKQIVGDGNTHISTDEEFEESTRIVQEASMKALKQKQNVKGRRRKIIKG